MIKTCVICDGEFETNRPNKTVCSAECMRTKELRRGAAKSRRKYARNPEKGRASEQRRRESDRDGYNKRKRELRSANPEKVRAIDRKRYLADPKRRYNPDTGAVKMRMQRLRNNLAEAFKVLNGRSPTDAELQMMLEAQ